MTPTKSIAAAVILLSLLPLANAEDDPYKDFSGLMFAAGEAKVIHVGSDFNLIYKSSDIARVSIKDKDPTSKKVATTLFKDFCQSGKQTRSYSEDVTFVVPKRTGVPVDQVTKEQAELSDVSSYFAKWTFYFGSHHLPTELSRSWLSKKDHFGLFLALVFETDPKIPDFFQSVRTPNPLPSLHQDLYVDRIDERFGFKARPDQFYWLNHKGHLYIVPITKNLSYVGEGPSSVEGQDKGWRMSSKSVRREDLDGLGGRILTLDTPMKIPVAGVSKVYPIAATGFGEIAAWVKNYTMFIPPSEQKKLMKEAGSDEPLGFKEGKPSPTEALKNQDLIWANYLIAFTKVEQSTRKDPQLIDMKITLDLEPFCKYGRLASDLIAK